MKSTYSLAIHYYKAIASSAKYLLVLVALAELLMVIAYQVQLPLYVNVGENDEKFVRGFYYSPEGQPVPARWTAGDGRIILRDTALVTPLTIVVRANAYRWVDHIYATTVTLNGHRVGVIDRANWRTWRFDVDDELLSGANELVVGLQSQTFVPSDLSPDYTDERELGILVDWIAIQPRWHGRLIFPSCHQLIFVALFVSGIYLAARIFGVPQRWSVSLAIGFVIVFAGIIAFQRTMADERILLTGLAIGLLAFVQAINTSKTSAGSRILMVIMIAILALVLRWHAAGLLPVEHDDQVYMEVAKYYAGAIERGNWMDVINFEPRTGHPILNKLIFASSLIVRNALGLRLSDLETMRSAAVLFGTLQVGLLTYFNPVAGWLLAIQSTEIKFTSIAYLEAVPAFTSLVAIIAFNKFRRTNHVKWLFLSAVALGATGASKFIYLNAGMAILIFLLWAQRRHWKTILLYLIVTGLAFLLFNPYLWADPLGRFLGMIAFHSRAVQDDFVKQYGRPWWYNLVTLYRPAVVFPSVLMERPPIFFFQIDAFIYLFGLGGLVNLARTSRLYLVWLCCGAIFLSLWGAKWEQYAMIIATPLCLSTGLGLTDLARWLPRCWGWAIRRAHLSHWARQYFLIKQSRKDHIIKRDV
jgi:hypothetical protein